MTILEKLVIFIRKLVHVFGKLVHVFEVSAYFRLETSFQNFASFEIIGALMAIGGLE